VSSDLLLLPFSVTIMVTLVMDCVHWSRTCCETPGGRLIWRRSCRRKLRVTIEMPLTPAVGSPVEPGELVRMVGPALAITRATAGGAGQGEIMAIATSADAAMREFMVIGMRLAFDMVVPSWNNLRTWEETRIEWSLKLKMEREEWKRK
jgi:hypothetical protein